MAPIDILHRIRAKWSGEPAQKPPALSSGTAAALSILFTLLYVVPFYLSKATRPSPQLSRDAPSSIKARVRAVTLSSIICSIITLFVVVSNAEATLLDALRLLGWWPISLGDIFNTMLLVCILFAGPLFEAGVVDGEWRYWIKGTNIRQVLWSWIGWRNYVAGPVTEELIWRSLIIPLHLLAHVSPKRIVFTTPLYFGIAHVHHYYEFRLTHPHTPALPAVLRSVFQFTYTSLFGFFAAFVFLRNGSLPALILAHSFCNWMGLPRFWGRVGVEAGVPIGPPGPSKKDDGKGGAHDVDVESQMLGAGWTVAYYVLLVAGAVGFYWYLFPLTESVHALESFE